MSPRLVPPLTVLVLLAGTAVASASNPVSTPNPKMNLHCTGSEMSADGLRAKNSLESSVIGGIRIGSVAEDAVIRRSETDRPVLLSAGGQQRQPYMVAALEMASNPAQGGTPASCYPGLSLATSSIPTATVGNSYTVTFVANGGQPPYSWSFGRSSLPQGFSLSSDGDLTGTPSKAGTYAFGVIVTDSLKTAMTGSLTLTVLADNDPPTLPPPTQPPPTQPPPTQPPPTQPPPTQPPPTQPPPTQPPPTQPPPTQPPPTQPPPTQPPPTQPPPTQPPTGTALSACGPITKSGSYYLANDVSSAGTCFPLGASGITLNLNGHTITYGTGGGTAPTPAFSACSSWYTGLDASQCVGGGANLTVYGGTIVQASNAAPFSPVFWIGQGSTGGGFIHDLTATFQSVGSQFFHGEIDGGGYKIQNNTINDNVTNIQHPGQQPLGARGQFQGYVIHTDEEATGNPPPDDISGNTFNGSPQGGIADGVANSQIYNNTIHLTSYYSNDYGVIITVNGQNVHDNTVTGRGRGLDGESSGFTLNHNTVNVAEIANNSEYSGCEAGGTYGIRIKNYNWPGSTESGTTASTSFQVTNNTVTVPSGPCAAVGLDLTDMSPQVTGTISGNNFTAVANTGGQVSDALSFNADNQANVTFQSNVFTAPVCIYIGGGGDIPYGSFAVQSGQTWNCSSGPTVQTADYTFGQAGWTPPVMTIQDAIPNPTVTCGSYSTATVTIGGGSKTTCNRQGN